MSIDYGSNTYRAGQNDGAFLARTQAVRHGQAIINQVERELGAMESAYEQERHVRLCMEAHAAGTAAWARAATKALRALQPDHLMFTKTGLVYENGDQQDGINLAYQTGWDARATELGLSTEHRAHAYDPVKRAAEAAAAKKAEEDRIAALAEAARIREEQALARAAANREAALKIITGAKNLAGKFFGGSRLAS